MQNKKVIYTVILVITALSLITRCDFMADMKNKNAEAVPSLLLMNLAQDIEIPEEELVACSSNDDCVTAKHDCCGCSAGGSSLSINKKYHDYWTLKMRKNCVDIVCPTIFVCKETENQCVENKCALVEKE